MNATISESAVSMEQLQRLNELYRSGSPEVSDAQYDLMRSALEAQHPDHPFFAAPEPAPIAGKRLQHIVPMLSTEKGYSDEEVGAWCRAVQAAAGGSDPLVRVMPKLDGIACWHQASSGLAITRGSNGYGTDISRHFGGRGGITVQGEGLGEIVVPVSYFDAVLAAEYGMKHPRNFVAGLVDAETLAPHHQRALADGTVHFVSYAMLQSVEIPLSKLRTTWESQFDVLLPGCPYICDGLVAEVVDPDLRVRLGSTSRAHRWQIALKRNELGVRTTVESLRWTVGRTGVITPTLNVAPVNLYGVTISWVTGHNAARVKDWGLGAGAEIEVIRAGGVIPACEVVLEPAAVPDPASMACPSCGSATEMRGPALFCTNDVDCPAQAAKRLEHFFKTIRVCKGFGPAVCDLLCAAGITKPHQVWGMPADEMIAAGLSNGVVSNLRGELARALGEEIPASLLLAALGVPNLGRGDSRKLVEVYPIEDAGRLTAAQIESVHGFGELTSGQISRDLQALAGQLEALLQLGWTFAATPSTAAVGGRLAGEVIATVVEHDVSMLKASPVRIAFPDTPIPYSRALEQWARPNAEKIVEAAQTCLTR